MKLRCAVLLRLGLKGVKIFWNVSKVCMHACDQIGIQIYDQISFMRNCSKGKLRHSISLTLGLKEGKMDLRNWKQMQPFRAWFHQVFLRSKIARNPLKVCMHGYLSNGYLNSLSNFTSKKAEKITSLSLLLDQA